MKSSHSQKKLISYKRILKLIKSGAIEGRVAEITRHNSHYVHERSTTVEVDWYTDTIDHPRIQEMLDALEEDIQEHHIQLNQEVYRDLEKEYDYLTSDEQVADALIANEYEFDKQGKMW